MVPTDFRSKECFGNANGKSVNKNMAFRTRSPYAVEKSAVHLEVANYRDAYELFACTLMLFNLESSLRPKRFAMRIIISELCEMAADKAYILELGNIENQNDWGWAPEYFEAMWPMLQQEEVEDFVISTGESHSFQDCREAASNVRGLNWQNYTQVNESNYLYSEFNYGGRDATSMAEILGWKLFMKTPDLVGEMTRCEIQ